MVVLKHPVVPVVVLKHPHCHIGAQLHHALHLQTPATEAAHLQSNCIAMHHTLGGLPQYGAPCMHTCTRPPRRPHVLRARREEGSKATK